MRVNLLPYQMVGKTGPNWQLVFTLSGIVLLASVTAIFYVSLQAQVSSYQNQIAAMEQEYQQYQAAIDRKAFLDQLQTVYTQKSTFIEQLAGEGVKWNLIMEEIRDIIPRTVIVDTMNSGDGGTINIVGRAGSLQALSHFMVNIQMATYVTKPDLQRIAWDSEESAFGFTMTCQPKEVGAGG